MNAVTPPTGNGTPAALSSSELGRVLAYLGVRPQRANHATLAALVAAYVRQVPWESAFRIARKDAAGGTISARRPADFWADAVERGGGGTCFESNYAFFALLQALGYAGYLTINDMGDAVGCHTAIVVEIAGERYLTDVGLPLHRPLRLSHARTTRSRGAFHTYVAQPLAADSYVIERTRHPKRYAFTLRDTPVADADYYAASTADYGDGGLFLDRVIVNKVVGERVWRFSSGEWPYRLEAFSQGGQREEIPIDDRDIVFTLAERFGMDAAVLERALVAVGAPHR